MFSSCKETPKKAILKLNAIDWYSQSNKINGNKSSSLVTTILLIIIPLIAAATSSFTSNQTAFAQENNALINENIFDQGFNVVNQSTSSIPLDSRVNVKSNIDATLTLDHLPIDIKNTTEGQIQTANLMFRDGVMKKIQYEVINGRAIFEGDIDLGPASQSNGEEQGQNTLGSVIKEAGKLWPAKTIPYAIDPNLPDKQRVLSAINYWNTNTVVQLVPHKNQKDFVTFRPGTSNCYSSVGDQGNGEQFIDLSSGCDFGRVLHEIGHAAGLWHEQSRSDRDSYVRINYENIIPDKKFNFDKHDVDGQDQGSYDYDSVMHYESTAFSKNGKTTIETLNGKTIGQRDHLSIGDIKTVKALYSQQKNVIRFTPIPDNSNPKPQTFTIKISEAHADEAVDAFGRPISYKKLSISSTGSNTVIKPQPVGFKVDISSLPLDEKITYVFCEMDHPEGLNLYNQECSVSKDHYNSIGFTGIPTNNLEEGWHTFKIIVYSEKGRSNLAEYRFFIREAADPNTIAIKNVIRDSITEKAGNMNISIKGKLIVNVLDPGTNMSTFAKNIEVTVDLDNGEQTKDSGKPYYEFIIPSNIRYSVSAKPISPLYGIFDYSKDGSCEGYVNNNQHGSNYCYIHAAVKRIDIQAIDKNVLGHIGNDVS